MMFCLNQNKFLKFIGLMLLALILLSSTNTDRKVVCYGAEVNDIDNGGIIIGIDLGTTYSASAMVDEHTNNVIVFPNDQGNRITPSYVSFDQHQRLIGDAAKNLVISNPLNTVFDSKRMIGRQFDDKAVQNSMKYWPFKVIKNPTNGSPNIEVEYKGEKRTFAPEEISAMILTKMKEIAETYLGKEVKKAVITVPAYFDDTQKAATRDAGRIAGLEVVRIIAEPTAAAMAYGIDKKHEEANVIIYDLGGGTFDVSLLNLDNGVFEVLATSGDTHLGGQDFDERVIKYFIKKFDDKVYKKQGLKKSLKNNERGVAKLRQEVEKAKRGLSAGNQIRIEIENIDGENSFSEILTRARFEEINNDLFLKTLKPLEQVLKDARLDKKDIQEIILVGGSTRIPKIQELVSKFFNGKQLNRGINPDEAVAHGAAIQAAILSPKFKDSDRFKNTLIIDSIPISLGIETAGGVMTTVLEKNTRFPSSRSQIFSTYQDNQQNVLIKVYQGERAMTKDNRFLGDFMLNDIPPAPRGVPQIEVTFEIDANGILNVLGKDKSNNNVNSITITADRQRLTQTDIDEMLRTAQNFADEDELVKKTVTAKNQLESSVYRLKSSLSNEDLELSNEDIDTLNEIIEETIQWLDDNPMAEYEDYRDKQKELDDIVNPIMSGYYANHHSGGGGNNEDFDHEEL